METEGKLIAAIRARTARSAARFPTPTVELGIGDDAALLRPRSDHELIVCCDTLVEGVHFTLDTATPTQIGRKSLAVNLSDVAAMGGKPTAALLAISVRSGLPDGFANRFLDGLCGLADRFGVAIVGGDTTKTDGPLTVTVTVLGEIVRGSAIRRSGARIGDLIVVTGELGGSLAGHHLDFIPRVDEARRLTQQLTIHAMMDLSDGLATDLPRLLTDSRVGAIVEADRIPIRKSAHDVIDNRTPLERALSDGEDFELLLTVPADEEELLRSIELPDCPVTMIGRIVAEPGLRLRHPDGKVEPLEPSGFEHRW